QPDELRADHLRAALPRLTLDAPDELVQRGGLPVLDVHRHLHDAGTRQLEPERAHAGEAAAGLAHACGDLPRRLERAAQVDVERDQRSPGTDDAAARGRLESRRPEIRAELTGVEPALYLGDPASPVEPGSALR